jgi:hypothetical protein
MYRHGGQVKMYLDLGLPGEPGKSSRSVIATAGHESVFVVEPGEPGGEPLHGIFELRVEVDELP